MDEIRYKPIGVIRSPFKSPGEAPRQPRFAQGTRGTVELLPEYARGLVDLDRFSHIILLCHLHLVTGYSLDVVPSWDNRPHGLFATRTPRRPNPIGMSVVRLTAIEGSTLHIEDIDMLDGTPVLDIKPYVAPFDSDEEPRQGWMAGKIQDVDEGGAE
jgi:tRNA-Thr(GGU) m(6)t(6)A37 methyltransferase TsaA